MSAAATSEPDDSFRASTRQRQTFFLEADDVAYGEALTRAFPGVRFWDYIPWNVRTNKERPPDVLPLRSLAECRGHRIDVVFDPAWRPQWVWVERYKEWKDQSSGFFVSGMIERNAKPVLRRTNLWILYSGTIYYRFDPDDKEQVAIARKALRLIDKVASNRDLMVVDVRTLEILYPTCIGAPSAGHHARRWCLEKPDRLLKFRDVRSTSAYRPKPE